MSSTRAIVDYSVWAPAFARRPLAVEPPSWKYRPSVGCRNERNTKTAPLNKWSVTSTGKNHCEGKTTYLKVGRASHNKNTNLKV